MKQNTQTVEIKELAIRRVTIPIIGISPLIVHAWSEKSKKEMRGKQDGAPKNKKHERRDPNDEYEQAKHKSPDGWDGFPVAGFKAAMIRASKSMGMVMKDTQTSFFIIGDGYDQAGDEMVRITAGNTRMRTDMVRVGMGSADLRYRPEYTPWSANLIVEFNAGMLSLDQIYQLVKAAGYCCGIGEMRPEKGKFNFGRFDLANLKN